MAKHTDGSEVQCVNDLASKGNVVVSRVLRITGLRRSFISHTGDRIAIDGTLADEIRASAELARSLHGKTELSVDKPFLVGCRVFRVHAGGGFVSESIDVAELSPGQVSELKRTGK